MDSPQQQALFYEGIEQALDAVIMACGGRKKFAGEMWPDKPAREAHNLMDACLNQDRREKFAPHQLLYILKRGHAVGFHGAMQFIASEIGYQPPQPIEPETELARLQREVHIRGEGVDEACTEDRGGRSEATRSQVEELSAARRRFFTP